jgi:hypothetical protein
VTFLRPTGQQAAGGQQAAVPFQVTAWLQQGVAQDARLGVALDGLLAGQLLREQLGVDYAATDPDDPTVDPPDLPLPLAACAAGGDWHWAATFAQPIPPCTLEVHYWHSRLDELHAELAVARLPTRLPSHHGRYRARRMPLVVTVTRGLRWRGVGDPDEVARLLTPVIAVGARRGHGEGAVLGWEVTRDPAGDPDRFAHLGPDGTLARPCPPGCAGRLGLPVGELGVAGLRPPYKHPRRQRQQVLPTLAVPQEPADAS